ncbi:MULTISPECIES: polysaccharide biosynthesis tyrosine autokinase [unclassified Pseudarthrobacter]|uniref:polysaccharide biosynthesis tyrosine autokinase n=1 Tax=unclassified Pseudarthrobacter TaxID=2647000 RepID=UPI003630DC83
MIGTELTADDTQTQGLTLADYLRVARSYWKSIVACALMGTLAASVWVILQPRVYASDSSGIVVAGGADNLSLSLAGDNLAKSKAKNFKSVGQSRLVADRVIADLGIDSTADALLSSITVAVPQDSAEIKVTAKSTVPEDAQRIADAWVRGITQQVAELESTGTVEGGAPIQPAVRVVPLGQAVVPTTPVAPNVPIYVAGGFMAGLIAGLVLAFLRNHLDRRIKTIDDVERLVGVSVIGTIPVDHRLDGGSFVIDAATLGGHDGGKGNNAISEALRELRTNLKFVNVDRPPRVIVVTSSVPSEGKSTVTANLAVAMASAGENVVVVDGDLRRPTVANVFQLVPGVGVTDVLSGRAEVSDVMQQWGALDNLSVLGSGPIPPNPSELLGSNAMAALLQLLGDSSTVLIDAPPLLPVTDAAILSRLSDGAIVVVRSGKTTQDELTRSIGNLRRAKGRVLGTILNCVPLSGADSYSYYGSYSSHDPELAVVPTPSNPALSEFDRLISSSGAPMTAEPHTFAPDRHRRSI